MDPAVVHWTDGHEILVPFAPEGVLQVVQLDVGIAAGRTDRGCARATSVFGQPPPAPGKPGRTLHVGEITLAVPATTGGPSGTRSWGSHACLLRYLRADCAHGSHVVCTCRVRAVLIDRKPLRRSYFEGHFGFVPMGGHEGSFDVDATGDE